MTDLPPPTEPVRIELWSDLSCPWCYVGSRRLHSAVESSEHSGRVELVLRSFELDPQADSEPTPLLTHLAEKFGSSVADVEQMESQVAALAEAEGLPYSTDRLNGNSLDVHRLTHLAARYGLAVQFFDRVQRAHFSGEASPYDHTVLTRIATEVGVPAEEVAAVLAGDEFTAAVRQDQDEARRLGVTGVPFAVFDRRFAVSGAQGVEVYRRALEQTFAAGADPAQ